MCTLWITIVIWTNCIEEHDGIFFGIAFVLFFTRNTNKYQNVIAVKVITEELLMVYGKQE